MLIGREQERARLDSLLADARSGRSGVLVLRGEPGIGKTALLDYAAGAGDGVRVLHARGVEAESELAFAALADLFRPALERIGGLPEPQAAALAGALALGPPATRDRFTICAATLSLLALTAEDGPLLALVDDAHWLDASSAEALLFAARRLEAEGAVLLFAVRDPAAGAFERARLPELMVGGLDEREAAELLRGAARHDVAPEVASRLARTTGGNPLALLQLAETLGEDQLAGRAPLPTARGVERPFVRRVTELPEDAQRALVVVAAGDSTEREIIERALDALGIGADRLVALEARGLVVRDDGRVRLRHPLFRSWVYHGASAPEQRAVHNALAEAAGREGAADRRSWHLAVAAPRPDEDVAAALEESAQSARRRGGHAEAASAFERAARLSTDAAERARLLLEAARDFRAAGLAERAEEMLDAALETSDDPLRRADVQSLRGRIGLWRGAENAAHDLLVAEAGLVEPHDAARAAVMLADAVMVAIAAGDIHAALATAERACAAGERAGDPIGTLARVALGTVLILRGEAERGRALTLLSDAFDAAGDPALPAHQLILFAGSALVWVEDYDKARRLLGGIAERARAASAPGELPFVLASLSDLDFRTGRWAPAYAGAAESVRLADETRQTSALPYSLACLARIEAAQGREDECRAHAARALEVAAAVGAGSIPLFARAALGLLKLGLGRPGDALTDLQEARRVGHERGLGEPAVAQSGADLVEAHARVGAAGEAAEALAAFEEQARATGGSWALAAVARCRGLLAGGDEFEAGFADALELHARTPTPFERARTELCLGERLRRARRRADARGHLRSALQTFESLGAVPWMDRARAELHATGETVRRREGPELRELTPQELQVALVVGQGATNREAGAALFLSPKTVEAHLGRIYRKLGVRSRTELAALVASDETLAEAAASS